MIRDEEHPLFAGVLARNARVITARRRVRVCKFSAWLTTFGVSMAFALPTIGQHQYELAEFAAWMASVATLFPTLGSALGVWESNDQLRIARATRRDLLERCARRGELGVNLI